MKSYIWLGLLLGLWVGQAWGANNAPATVPMVASGSCSTFPNCPVVPNSNTAPFLIDGVTGTRLALDASIQSLITILNAPLSLPSGAATSALQTTANGYLLTLSTFTTSASTSALQSTGNGYLSTLATASASQATAANQATANGSLATIATNSGTQATAAKQDTGNTNTGAISTGTGAPADAAYSGSGSSSIIAALKGIYAKLAGTLTVSGTVTTTPSGGTVPAPYVITPIAPDISTVTTGGTAVNAFSAGHCSKGCLIVNPKGATVDLCVNGVSTASGTTTAGALICIPPGQQFGFTPRATAISAVSSDSSHPFGGEGYQ